MLFLHDTVLLLTLFFSLLFYASQVASAEQNAKKQLYAKTVSVANHDIKRIAKDKNWQHYSVKMNIFIPNEIDHFLLCKTPLQLAGSGSGRNDLARFRYIVRCEDERRWEIAVTVKPEIHLPIWIANKVIERGTKISQEDIVLHKHNISTISDHYITDANQIIGLMVKRRVHDRQPLSLSHLEQPILVTRGQQVVMIAEEEGVVAQMLGQVLKNGRKGERIKVRNLSSGKIIEAVVNDLGVVKMLMRPRL
ncbi:flagellar basal body P-ring formation chaperone FlgA [Candidatus Regiella endosymbiont of Tuberolachnus salignus]|uniref:flagellar basal body P-ring formation chaperone FlgA n=1 Tax=Candidatus Regiella endosymbiont of Tuberolachnus salignus TaxID=3077956 RepID=UPI0030D0379F